MSPLPLKLLSLTLLCAAAAMAASTLITRADSVPNRLVRRYVLALDARLYALQSAPRGWLILSVQVGLLAVALLALAAAGPNRWLLGAVVLVVAAPVLWLGRLGKKRREEIDRQLNTFATALANALRASPSLGKALKRMEEVVSGPLAEELSIVLKELRLGATVDQALLNLNGRVGSAQLDVIVCSLLIGRQVGGRLPDVLESTASSLREMERMEGVLRSKTSESKGQLAVMALAPPLIFVIFDNLKEGYFEPLTESFAGYVLCAVGIACWGLSVVLARAILSVEV